MTCFLDLFSGIGGFALGAEWAGMKFDKHYFSEVDDYAIKVYMGRFPGAIALGDITKIDGRQLSAGEWTIAGGFPCQDISVAGKGAGMAGARSGLWFEYARIIGELRPRYAIMENVGALTHRGLDRVLGSLAEIGYDAEWQDIRASDVGAPHRRERIWIVAYPELHGRAASAERGSVKTAVRQEQAREGKSFDFTGSGSISAAEGNVVNPNGKRCEKQSNRLAARAMAIDSEHGRASMADAENGGNVRGDGQLEPIKREMREHRGSQKNGRGEWWAAEPDVGRVAHGVPSRVDRLKCLGNSIVPQIAMMIFQQIKEIEN